MWSGDLRRRVLRLLTRVNRNRLKARDEQPLRSELFSTVQLEEHAKSLAGWHEVDKRTGPDRLLNRLEKNESVLRKAHQLLVTTAATNRRMSPADESLLDNFYLIEEQIRTARRHLPKNYSRQLPRLRSGPLSGFPRVYDIALELISHGDGRISSESLASVVAAYQSVTPLTLGELWAIPIMLRLALIENLRRVAARMTAARMHRDDANAWADRMMEAVERDPKDLVLVMAEMSRAAPAMDSEFAAEFARRLREQSPAMALPLMWLEHRLAEQAVTVEQLMQIEGQQQAADQVSLNNSISSLRFLAAIDWRRFVESLSLVEQTLCGYSPGVFENLECNSRHYRHVVQAMQGYSDVYSEMDFATRDRYRHVVERIASESPLAEWEVAARAVQLAKQAADAKGVRERTAHVGYYLIDRGLSQLETAVQAHISLAEKLRRSATRHSLLLYLGAISTITFAMTAIAVVQAWSPAIRPLLLLFVALPVLLGSTHLSMALVNWLVTLLVTPQRLPRMDLSKGIPSESRTLVIVPTMLTSSQGVDDLIEGLEVRYLANRDEHLHFSLLTDWRDAAAESMPDDHAMLDRAREGIEALNAKYKSDRSDIFSLFHRPRRWNPQEKIWMGYERKRGKIADLNAFLRGGAHERFALIVGDTTALGKVKYVITLDTDTQLPRDSARQLVGTIVHPLNRPRFDDHKNLLCDGYSILQPRVAVSLPSAGRSWFVRIFGGQAGIDPYTGAVSDVYQDLFQEGSFIGKGIYDVDAFDKLLNDRFPENLILSHDLVEGCHARSALISDLELFEAYPAQYGTDVSRRHRWIRGDWQIARWMLPWVPNQNGDIERNPLSLLSRWKIFDNLRRSLVPAALLVLLGLSWLTPVWSATFGTLFVLTITLLPIVLRVLVDLFKRSADLSWRLHLGNLLRPLRRSGAQAICALAFLPDEAYYSLDAVLRTLTRLIVTKRNLLQWRISTDAEQGWQNDLVAAVRDMWFAPVLSLAVGSYLVRFRTDALPVSVPLLLVWLISPAIAWRLSRPLPSTRTRLNADETIFLELLSRETWRFFETFVGPEDNWLPPDNYQEYPVAVIAHRTSPTNVGLALLSNLAAYDFGFISAGQCEERTTKTFASLEKLERFRGHFFNWYDTRTLEPLPPRYVSTVDSGNLVGHLLTLREGLLQLADEKILPNQAIPGLVVTLRGLISAIRNAEANAIRPAGRISAESEPHPWCRLELLLEEMLHTAHTLEAGSQLIAHLATTNRAVIGQWTEHSDKQVSWWADALLRQIQAWLEEVNLLAPLATLPPIPHSLRQTVAAPETAVLSQLHATLERINATGTLRDIAQLRLELAPLFEGNLPLATEHRDWLALLQQRICEIGNRAAARMASHEKLARACLELSDAEFGFLFDESRKLLSIGYNVAEHRLDASFYDLLASEARLASFVAIAQGQLPQDHWFALGRQLTGSAGSPTLLSWSGSMFEYLMPLLVMPNFDDTLLGETFKGAVARQIDYAASRNVPWGMSESGYNLTDVHLNYQYRAFGVPGLGFKRGLADDLVVAPYASVMALMVAPQAACANLRRLSAAGLEGGYGYYEAIDYTPSRFPRGQSFAVVRSFMAHHEGMSFLSLAYVLLDRPMQRRFEAYPPFQATELLLHERIPKAAPVDPASAESAATPQLAAGSEALMRVLNTPHTAIPEVHLLSNGNYHVMINNAGAGYSRWRDLAVTRWREDLARDDTGTFCYLRDVASNESWSVGYQPTLQAVSGLSSHFPPITGGISPTRL